MKKSFGNSLFRINFSRSGVSYSFGVKGARLNVSQRGTYVSFGSNGIYYRKKISGNNPHEHSNPYLPPAPALIPEPVDRHTITSTNIENITDTDSQDFINELTEKGKKIPYYKWLGIVPMTISAMLLLYVFFSTKTLHPATTSETKYFINTSSDVNIRNAPDKKSEVSGVLGAGDQRELLSDTNKDWYKISNNGHEGYVSKKITEKKAVTTTREINPGLNNSLYEIHPFIFWLCAIIFAAIAIPWLRYLKRTDRKRLLVQIHYDIDEKVGEVYEKFVHHFSSLLQCRKTWQYLHSQRTYDYKYTSGAGQLITRKPLTKISADKKPSRIFETNVQIPYLGLINTELYFFPERLIIKRGDQYGGIMYRNIDCDETITHFIETEGVPADSIVVGHTWRFLNKNGTPDRRFNNNYKIPICKYSEYYFTSASGLNEKIVTSKVNALQEFVRYVRAIGMLQKHINHHSS